MLKTIVLLGAGIVLGGSAACMWVQRGDASGEAGAGGTSFLSELGGALRTEREPQVPRAESPLLAFREAARFDDAAALEAALVDVAERPHSAARTLEIDALLMRFVEINPRAAVRAAQSLRLGDRIVATVFGAWARADPDAALRALGALQPAAAAAAAALAVLEELGADEAAAERVSAALPEAYRPGFEGAAMGVRAEHDLLGTFRAAYAIGDDAERRRAFMVVGQAWAKDDPIGALSQASALPETDQASFRNAVVTEWASLDPDAVFAYLETVDPRLLESLGSVQALAAIDANRLFELSQRMPSSSGISSLQFLAFNALARADPRAMIARAQAMPPGNMREQAVQMVASSLAREDPDAAVAFVKNLDPPSSNARLSVISAIAAFDLDRALELVPELDPGGAQMMTEMVFSSAFSNLSSDPQKLEATAAKLVARNDPTSKRALASFVQSWASRDHDAAVNWALANAQSMDGQAFGNLASRVASRDIQAAVAYLERVPAEHRSIWIQQVAGPYARYDLPGALTWIAAFKGDPAYDTAFQQLVTQAAQTDPRAAARLLDEAPPSANVAQSAASRVASLWARQEPAAAAEWALARGDAAERTAAVSTVASSWAQRDPAGAARWARGVPADARDAALQGVLTAMAGAGTVDMALFSAFGSDRARQQAAQRVVVSLARRDVGEARAVMDAYITDPAMRRTVEQQLERAQAQPSLGSGSSFIVIN